MNKKQVLALLLCVALCAAMAVSFSFIIFESKHECAGEHCRICAELQVGASLIRNILCVCIPLLFAARIFNISGKAGIRACGIIRADSLAALKVKLSN